MSFLFLALKPKSHTKLYKDIFWGGGVFVAHPKMNNMRLYVDPLQGSGTKTNVIETTAGRTQTHAIVKNTLHIISLVGDKNKLHQLRAFPTIWQGY